MITEDDIVEVLQNPEAFFRLLKIVDKTGKVIQLELNEEQQKFIRSKLDEYYKSGAALI